MPKPKAFNETKTLIKIMKIFWSKGYRKTSLADLTKATGLNKMSLYNAYGNKERMFTSSLELYSKYSKEKRGLKSSPEDGLKFLHEFFQALTTEAVCKKNSNGCFVMNSKLEMENDIEDPKYHFANKYWENISSVLFNSVKAAKEKGELSPKTNANSFSKWLLSQAFLIKQMSKFSNDQSTFKEILKQIELNIKSKKST